jgi:hypothetical protein
MISYLQMENFSFQKSSSFGANQNQPQNDTNLIEIGKGMSQRYERSGTLLHLSNEYQKIVLYI